jgi:hypothetical protein
MKTFSISCVSLIAMAGLAHAQGAPKPPDPKAATPGAAAGGGAKAGAGAAAKPGAGPQAQAGAAPQAQAVAPAAPKPAPEAPRPPAELAAHAKAFGGTWRCTGIAMDGPDMKTELKFAATMKGKTDLDGWWIRSAMDGKMGDGKTATKFKMESFSTYDASAKKWRTVGVMNDGGLMLGTSDGPKDGKMQMTSDTWGPWGQGQMRETHDATDPKAVKMSGEMSMDRGKSWLKVYDMTCKR